MTEVELVRYSDRGRLNLARNAAIYLGKEDRDNVQRPLSILRSGHTLEIFRGEYAEFSFKGVTKEVYDHLTTYTTRNMRVTHGNRASLSDGFSLPRDRMNDSSAVSGVISRAMQAYHDLASLESPQVARSAMPCGAHMNEFVLQFNFATLIQAVFPQRLWTRGAQGNTRYVVGEMFKLVKLADEELWSAAEKYFGFTVQAWMQAYRRLSKTHEGMETVRHIIDAYGSQKSMWE